VPAEQAKHEVLCLTLEYFPALQMVHALAPATEEAYPSAQERQLL